MEIVGNASQYLKSFWKRISFAILFLLLIFILFWIFLPNTTTPGKFDRRCWITWSNYMLSNGLWNIYKLGVNYLPLYHYVLFVYAKLQGNTENIIFNINSLKLFTFFFELLGVFFLMILARKRYVSEYALLGLSLFIIFNPAFFYDSILYGQVDGLYSTFLFISVFFGIIKKPAFSLLTFVIALNLKLQAVTFLPLICLVNLENVLRLISFNAALKILLPALLLQLIIWLPFIFNGDMYLLWAVIKGSEGKYPFVSMGAYNFWYYFFEDPRNVSDLAGFFGRSYRRYGQGLYTLMIFLAMFPYIKWNYDLFFTKRVVSAFPIEKILLLGVMMAVIFFYFNTEMHSRYVHAAMIFAGAYFLYTKRVVIFSLLSLAYFLNIEKSAKIIKGDIIEYTYFFFNPVFISTLFALVLVLCYIQMYSNHKNSTQLHSMHQLSD